MPKARASRPANSLFTVSPWNDTRSRGADRGGAEGDYCVVEEPLVVAPAGGSAPDPPPVAPSPPVAVAWRTARRGGGAGAAAPLDGGGAPMQASDWETTSEGDDEAAEASPAAPLDDDLDGAAAAAPAPAAGGGLAGGLGRPSLRLEGAAFLAALPDGALSGHLIVSPTEAYGLRGEPLFAEADCTRGAEWSLVRLSVVDFRAAAGGGAAAAAAAAPLPAILAERTGGDALRLRAPPAWEGDEAADAAAAGLGAGCAPAAWLTFDCERLLADAAADAVLETTQPALVGAGAAVSVGRMTLFLPRGGSAGGGAGGAVAPAPPRPGSGGGAAPADDDGAEWR
jgi:hypothetical protein